MEQSHQGHGSAHSTAEMNDHGQSHVGDADVPDHVRENMAKMAVTMSAMAAGMANADPDVAFACGMIAHHQAAIDMAQIELQHGSDERMRKLAEEIVGAQTAEIERMKLWLDNRQP